MFMYNTPTIMLCINTVITPLKVGEWILTISSFDWKASNILGGRALVHKYANWDFDRIVNK